VKSDLELFTAFWEKERTKVDRALGRLFQGAGAKPRVLAEAMKYSALSKGKRLRAVLAVLGFSSAGRRPGAGAYRLGCALELIHAYSLVHDDLPCMDNDDLRRGKPTCHKVYGEGIAMLAGVGLLVRAFELIFDLELRGVDSRRVLAVARSIAGAIGHEKMIAGQAMDLIKEGRQATLAEVKFIHERKTAAFIEASLVSGALLGGAPRNVVEELSGYGRRIGLAFQIADDILNQESSVEQLGKATGTDRLRRKATYPAVVGVEKSRKAARKLTGEAQEMFPRPTVHDSLLRGLADFVLARTS